MTSDRGAARAAKEVAATAAATARIEATLGALSPEMRAALQALRQTIAAAAPEAVEAISYGVPAFRYHGHPLVAYAAATRHCSLFPMGSALIEAHRADLAGFDTAKGTIRFTPANPLPTELVTRIVHARMAMIDAANAARPGS